MPSRTRVPLLVATAALLVAVGCAPAGMDAQQKQAESRECASLLARHVTGRNPVGALVIHGRTIDLGRDPKTFFDTLAELRGVDAFSLSGTKADTTTRASFVSDLCKPKDASTSRSSTASTTTGTTTTTTAPAAPGSGG